MALLHSAARRPERERRDFLHAARAFDSLFLNATTARPGTYVPNIIVRFLSQLCLRALRQSSLKLAGVQSRSGDVHVFLKIYPAAECRGLKSGSLLSEHFRSIDVGKGFFINSLRPGLRWAVVYSVQFFDISQKPFPYHSSQHVTIQM